MKRNLSSALDAGQEATIVLRITIGDQGDYQSRSEGRAARIR